MIKNIIFDLGNVLIDYNPIDFIEKNIKKENQQKFLEIVFKSQEWLDLDRGCLEYEEAIEIFSKKLPEEKQRIEDLFNNNIEGVLFPNKKNIEFLKELKEKNLNLYILSNFHKNAFLNMAKKYGFNKYFDGGVISYECKLLKPEKEIFLTILENYNLIPEETLFIDDTLINIETAKQMGIKTIHLEEINSLIDRITNFF